VEYRLVTAGLQYSCTKLALVLFLDDLSFRT
jgi:hypothetical protein